MLTREQTIAEIDFANGLVVPDRLTRKSHGQYLGYADRMLDVYRAGAGRTRRELHRAVWTILADEPDCPVRRVEAFCKLLDDASTFARDAKGKAAQLRSRVFKLAAARHPLVVRADRLFEHEEAAVKADIARELGRTWPAIDEDLFADIIEYHRLAEFEGYPDAAALLARYNVAQTQAALYDAASMTIWASDDFKAILRAARLARLMHSITRLTGQRAEKGDKGEFCIRLDGPASVLRETRRYGAAMARFLPGLIACKDWRMHAVIARPRWTRNLRLELSSQDGLTSHRPAPEEFDSSVEAAFARKWGEEPRDGWRLIREGEILFQGQKVFVPDFGFQHADARSVLLEIIGFWTPEYLEAKLKTLAAFADHPILLAVAKPLKRQLPNLPASTITYGTAIPIKAVLERLNDPSVLQRKH